MEMRVKDIYTAGQEISAIFKGKGYVTSSLCDTRFKLQHYMT